MGEYAPSRGDESIGEGSMVSAPTAQHGKLSDNALLLRLSRCVPRNEDESIGEDFMPSAGPAAQLCTLSAGIIMAATQKRSGWPRTAQEGGRRAELGWGTHSGLYEVIALSVWVTCRLHNPHDKHTRSRVSEGTSSFF